ncbi:MAG: type VII toxin-antitoxin system HepT family RNase toxin [Pseudonocardiaceae bacterium]
MTPRRLDPSIVHARLSIMRGLLDDLAGVDTAGTAPLAENRMLRHGVERILTQLVELATAINEHVAGARLHRVATTYRESFDLAAECGLIDKQLRDDLLPSVGMRNVLVYDYLEIDLRKVAVAVPLALSCYRRYVQQVAEFVIRVG